MSAPFQHPTETDQQYTLAAGACMPHMCPKALAQCLAASYRNS